MSKSRKIGRVKGRAKVSISRINGKKKEMHSMGVKSIDELWNDEQRTEYFAELTSGYFEMSPRTSLANGRSEKRKVPAI